MHIFGNCFSLVVVFQHRYPLEALYARKYHPNIFAVEISLPMSKVVERKPTFIRFCQFVLSDQSFAVSSDAGNEASQAPFTRNRIRLLSGQTLC